MNSHCLNHRTNQQISNFLKESKTRLYKIQKVDLKPKSLLGKIKELCPGDELPVFLVPSGRSRAPSRIDSEDSRLLCGKDLKHRDRGITTRNAMSMFYCSLFNKRRSLRWSADINKTIIKKCRRDGSGRYIFVGSLIKCRVLTSAVPS